MPEEIPKYNQALTPTDKTPSQTNKNRIGVNLRSVCEKKNERRGSEGWQMPERKEKLNKVIGFLVNTWLFSSPSPCHAFYSPSISPRPLKCSATHSGSFLYHLHVLSQLTFLVSCERVPAWAKIHPQPESSSSTSVSHQKERPVPKPMLHQWLLLWLDTPRL